MCILQQRVAVSDSSVIPESAPSAVCTCACKKIKSEKISDNSEPCNSRVAIAAECDKLCGSSPTITFKYKNFSILITHVTNIIMILKYTEIIPCKSITEKNFLKTIFFNTLRDGILYIYL